MLIRIQMMYKSKRQIKHVNKTSGIHRCHFCTHSDLCTGINGLNQTGSYTLADGNCRTYMKCRADGYDDPFCCRQDYFYNATSARCELLEDENDVCRSEVCPRGYKEGIY